MAFDSREQFVNKVIWEGGILQGLYYGLTKEDVPEGDTALYNAWEALEVAFAKVPEAIDVIDALLTEYY